MSGRASRLVLTLVVLATSACGIRGLDFKADRRLSFTYPKDRAEVRLPVTIRWRIRDFEITGRDGSQRNDAGYFGVYVDRAPQPPSRTQAFLLRNDARCVRQRSCADPDVLAQADIHSTTDMKFTVSTLPPPSSNAVKRREFHEVTVALLDGRGERIGEGAFRIEFEVDRDEL